MKDVLDILEHLGYRELRPEGKAPGAGDWRPIEDVNGRFGTTDETHVISRKRKATARLVDPGTGQLVATARKSCPLERATNGAHG
jgi:hypothetical protein